MFVNAVELNSTNDIAIAGAPGADLSGYRIAAGHAVGTVWTAGTTFVIPAGTVIPASGVKTVSPGLFGKASTVVNAVFALLTPNADPLSPTGLVEYVRLFSTGGTYTGTGPLTGHTSTYRGVDSNYQSTSSTVFGYQGTAPIGTKGTMTWANTADVAINLDAANDGQTFTTTTTTTPAGPVAATGLVGRVVSFLGQPPGRVRFEAQVAEHLAVISLMASSYTRGQGFAGATPLDDSLSAVIVSATARLVANPEQLESQIGTVALRAGFKGWSLAELAVLNAWRGVAR